MYDIMKQEKGFIERSKLMDTGHQHMSNQGYPYTHNHPGSFMFDSETGVMFHDHRFERPIPVEPRLDQERD